MSIKFLNMEDISTFNGEPYNMSYYAPKSIEEAKQLGAKMILSLSTEGIKFVPGDKFNDPYQIVFGKKASRFEYNICYINPKTISIEELSFVHGSEEELLKGKLCVTRNHPNLLVEGKSLLDMPSVNIKKGDKILFSLEYDTLPFKSVKVKEGTLIFLGKTQNNNYKIILK